MKSRCISEQSKINKKLSFYKLLKSKREDLFDVNRQLFDAEQRGVIDGASISTNDAIFSENKMHLELISDSNKLIKFNCYSSLKIRYIRPALRYGWYVDTDHMDKDKMKYYNTGLICYNNKKINKRTDKIQIYSVDENTNVLKIQNKYKFYVKKQRILREINKVPLISIIEYMIEKCQNVFIGYYDEGVSTLQMLCRVGCYNVAADIEYFYRKKYDSKYDKVALKKSTSKMTLIDDEKKIDLIDGSKKNRVGDSGKGTAPMKYTPKKITFEDAIAKLTYEDVLQIPQDKYETIGVLDVSTVRALRDLQVWSNQTPNDEKLSQMGFMNYYRDYDDERHIRQCILDSEENVIDMFLSHFVSGKKKTRESCRLVRTSLHPITKRQVAVYIKKFSDKVDLARENLHELVDKVTTNTWVEEKELYLSLLKASVKISRILYYLKLGHMRESVVHAIKRAKTMAATKSHQFAYPEGSLAGKLGPTSPLKGGQVPVKSVRDGTTGPGVEASPSENIILAVINPVIGGHCSAGINSLTVPSSAVGANPLVGTSSSVGGGLLVVTNPSIVVANSLVVNNSSIVTTSLVVSSSSEPRSATRLKCSGHEAKAACILRVEVVEYIYMRIKSIVTMQANVRCYLCYQRYNKVRESRYNSACAIQRIFMTGVVKKLVIYLRAQQAADWEQLWDPSRALMYYYNRYTFLSTYNEPGMVFRPMVRDRRSDALIQAWPFLNLTRPADHNQPPPEEVLLLMQGDDPGNVSESTHNPLCQICSTRKTTYICYDCEPLNNQSDLLQHSNPQNPQSSYCYPCFQRIHTDDPKMRKHNYVDMKNNNDSELVLLCNMCTLPATRKCLGIIDEKQIDILLAALQRNKTENWMDLLERANVGGKNKMGMIFTKEADDFVLTGSQLQSVRTMLERTRAECDENYCGKCYKEMHEGGKRILHRWQGFHAYATVCTVCTRSPAEMHCEDCNTIYCTSCYKVFHAMGRKRKHRNKLIFEKTIQNVDLMEPLSNDGEKNENFTYCSTCVRRIGDFQCGNEKCAQHPYHGCDSCFECVHKPECNKHEKDMEFILEGTVTLENRDFASTGCVMCGEKADHRCVQCQDLFCSRTWMGNPGCFIRVHDKGNRVHHTLEKLIGEEEAQLLQKAQNLKQNKLKNRMNEILKKKPIDNTIKNNKGLKNNENDGEKDSSNDVNIIQNGRQITDFRVDDDNELRSEMNEYNDVSDSDKSSDTRRKESKKLKKKRKLKKLKRLEKLEKERLALNQIDENSG